MSVVTLTSRTLCRSCCTIKRRFFYDGCSRFVIKDADATRAINESQRKVCRSSTAILHPCRSLRSLSGKGRGSDGRTKNSADADNDDAVEAVDDQDRRRRIDKDPEVLSALEEIRRDFRHEFRLPDEIGRSTTGDQQPQSKPLVSRHLQEKFVLYEDADAEVILDVHEELDEQLMDHHDDDDFNDSEFVQRPRERKPISEDLNLERGLSGVYDIGDLVAVLQSENAIDICAIKVPIEFCYADYLVIVSGRSPRHVKAIVEFVLKMYKRKKSIHDDFIKIQGEDSKDWMALDMGNIVLHVMLPEVRERYDIESLWSVGEKYDRQCQQPHEPVLDALQKHIKFLNEVKPLPA